MAEHLLTEIVVEKGINIVPELLEAKVSECHMSVQYLPGSLSRIVSQMSEEIATPTLIDVAKEGNLYTRLAALDTLIHFPKTAIPLYIETLKDEETAIRWRGLINLRVLLRNGQVDNRKEVISVIASALKDKDESICSEAEKIINELGREAIPVLVHRLQNNESSFLKQPS